MTRVLPKTGTLPKTGLSKTGFLITGVLLSGVLIVLCISCSTDSQPDDSAQANQSQGMPLTSATTRPAATATTQKGTPDALQSLKERLQRDAERLSSDADPTQLKKEMQETIRAFFKDTQEGTGIERYLLTDAEIRSYYQDSIARILIGGRSASNLRTAKELANLSQIAKLDIEGVEVETPHWYPVTDKSILRSAAHLIATCRVHFRAGPNIRMLSIKNSILTAKGWRFLQLSIGE